MEKKGPRAQHLASRPSQPPDHEEQPPPRSPAPPRFPAAESPGEGFTHQSRLWGLDTAENPVPAGWGRGKKENWKLTESTRGDGVLRILGGAQVPCSAPCVSCLWRRDATTPARPQKPGTTLPLQTHSRSSLLRAGKLSPNPRSWWSSSSLRFPG